MNIQAALALTAALVGLQACTPDEFNAALNRIEDRQDQQDKDLAAAQALLLRYAPSSSQQQTSSSSSSSSSAPEPVVVAAVSVEPSSSAAPPPDPPRESCDHSVVGLYDCVDGLRYYW